MGGDFTGSGGNESVAVVPGMGWSQCASESVVCSLGDNMAANLI